MNWWQIILSIALTFISYTTIPLICLRVHGGKFDQKKAHIISLWNTIAVAVIFCVISVFYFKLNWTPATSVIYYLINKALLSERQAKSRFTVRRIALDAVLIALYVILGFWKIPIGNLLRIRR